MGQLYRDYTDTSSQHGAFLIRWYASDEWTLNRKSLLQWILSQPNAGQLGLALLRLQSVERFVVPINLPKLLREIEAGYINDALDASSGNIKKAATALGIPATTLSHRLQKLGLTKQYMPSIRRAQ